MHVGLKKLWRRITTGRMYFTQQQWSSITSQIKLLEHFTHEERTRLRELAEDFLNTKTIEGAGGVALTLQIKQFIAIQACVPILNLGLDYYDGWYAVVVYPGEFRVPQEYLDADGVVHQRSRDLAGESWHRGPVILSWDNTARDALGLDATGNLVVHELAHKIDLLNGKANGMPPLHPKMDRRKWTQAFSAAFEDFNERIQCARELPFDPYGAESPGEFFAVASETFFVNPHAVYSAYPEVYSLLSQFYRQDPGKRMGRLNP